MLKIIKSVKTTYREYFELRLCYAEESTNVHLRYVYDILTFHGVKLYVGAWTGSIWLRIGAGGGHL